jgi:hypothetical protein
MVRTPLKNGFTVAVTVQPPLNGDGDLHLRPRFSRLTVTFQAA